MYLVNLKLMQKKNNAFDLLRNDEKFLELVK